MIEENIEISCSDMIKNPLKTSTWAGEKFEVYFSQI